MKQDLSLSISYKLGQRCMSGRSPIQISDQNLVFFPFPGILLMQDVNLFPLRTVASSSFTMFLQTPKTLEFIGKLDHFLPDPCIAPITAFHRLSSSTLNL
ncbi:hypothetical protein HanPI659440_Chr03g0123021 [Helianthus annuus]|nr:hypothetical protein HanPI659440_Chr03g0123021 [Helianthus annuus]